MIVDFHTHTFPPQLAQRALESLKQASGTEPYSDGTDDGLLASMDRAGVDYSVILPVATHPLQCEKINRKNAERQETDCHDQSADWSRNDKGLQTLRQRSDCHDQSADWSRNDKGLQTLRQRSDCHDQSADCSRNDKGLQALRQRSDCHDQSANWSRHDKGLQTLRQRSDCHDQSADWSRNDKGLQALRQRSDCHDQSADCSRNDKGLQALRQGSCLLYFGAMHPDCPTWKEELTRIATEGFRGIKLHPVYQGVDFNDPRYLRILEKAGELGLTVVIHAGDDIGFPGAVRCSPELIADALRQVGPVRLVLAHMGGWRNWDRVIPLLAQTNVYLDTSISLGEIQSSPQGRFAGKALPLLSPEEFLRIVRTFGAKRILFGTDSPWDDQAAALDRLRALPLSEAELAAILGGNAAGLLGLK